MPSKAKAKNAAAHQHDKRHESGLAAPGKRVTKQRSNTHLNSNGQPNGRPVASVSAAAAAAASPSQPTSGIIPAYTFSRTVDATRSASNNNTPCTYTQDYACHNTDGRERERTSSDASNEGGVGSCGETVDDLLLEQHTAANHSADRQFNMRRSGTSSAHPTSTLAVVSTILTYYPLRDAISILILLLSLPPTLVLVIQTLFASLTFIPPTAAISLPSIKDMFNASSLGYPAMATILLVDLIFYLCWLPVWKPVQSIFLDLSQAVIAVSLSGAAASTGGPTYSIVTCSAVVCVVHVLRYKAIHLTALDYLRSVLHKLDLVFDVDIPSSASSFIFAPPSSHGWIYTAVRTLLGIHIVSQGVTTCIRRSLASANEKSNALPAITRSESETLPSTVGTSYDGSVRSAAALADIAQHPPSAQSTDGRSPGPPPALRDGGGKVRESNTKKKRKQANQVRSQQPLWAAIASTKVTFVKEMEQRDAADDAKEATIMDRNTDLSTSFATSTRNTNTDRIWISEVRDTEVFFSVELSSRTLAENERGMHEESRMGAGIDRSKPFYVRVNGASWSSTRILPSAAGDESKNNRFDGEIFGLTPLSSYHCEIVSMVTQCLLYSANLISQSARTAEQTPVVPIAPLHPALRPSSPVTTLKQSIQQAETRLMETRSKTKKTKRDQRAAYSDIKREINGLKSKLDNSGGMDDKQSRRLQQISQHKNQAEEATVQLSQQIQALGDLPEDEIAESETKRRDWQSALNAKSTASQRLDGVRAEADREFRDLKSEFQVTEGKREKLTSRHQQRRDELEGVLSRQRAEMSARQKHDYERAVRREEQEKAETQLRYHVAAMSSEADLHHAKAVEAYQQGLGLQNWSTQPAPGVHGYSSPPTPEAVLPGTNGNNISTQSQNGNSHYASSYAAGYHVHQQAQNSVPPPRGRSSSMLSQYSGFTDNGDDFPFEPRHQYHWHTHKQSNTANAVDERKGSEPSSGSSGTNGSTASSSPRPDVLPFLPAKMSPIGPPSKKSSSPQTPDIISPGAVGSGR